MCEVKAVQSHLLLLATLAICPNFLQAQVQPQAWAKHVETLLEVAIHTENDPKFLDWAEVYCDSLAAVESYTTLAQENVIESIKPVVVMVNGEYRLVSSVAGVVKKSKKANGVSSALGALCAHEPERGRSLDVRWYDSETKKLKALPMKFSSTEDTDMEARLELTCFSGYTCLALTFGPEDCPLL